VYFNEKPKTQIDIECETNKKINKKNKKNNKCKSQYKSITIFKVKAKIEDDIYELYAYDPKTKTPIFYDIAGINYLDTSKMMNTIFRNINNKIDLDKEVLMECQYNEKFNKWFPIKKSFNTTYISILQL
jgi:hypothetical protein